MQYMCKIQACTIKKQKTEKKRFTSPKLNFSFFNYYTFFIEICDYDYHNSSSKFKVRITCNIIDIILKYLVDIS